MALTDAIARDRRARLPWGQCVGLQAIVDGPSVQPTIQPICMSTAAVILSHVGFSRQVMQDVSK